MPFKKTFSIIFSVLMSMSCLSAPVWAEPADTVQETDQSPPEDGLFFEEDVETAVPDVEFENDEMLNAYLETILYSDVEDSDHVSFGLTYAQVDNVAENCLTGSALGFYRALKENSEKVASGEVTSTQFAINTASYGIKRDFTAAELGLQSISGTTVAVKNAIKEKLAEELDFASVLTCLLNDNPYIMYWFDKTMGASYSYSAGVMQSDSGYYVSVPKITVKMYVAPGYYDVEDGTALVVDPYAVELATEASNNAKQIVTKHAGEGDYAKVCSYRDEIYALVAYDYDAANIGTFEDYGTSDPWQLIWVFDGDPDTNVVCEGYSKAMQYLCDLSSFESPNIECYSVTGELGGGGHMWNILVMDDGVPYLVDLTNSDEGTIGESDGVFLDGAVSGSVEDGFVMRNFGPSLMFVYDENTLATTAYDVLNISMTDYAPVSSIISNHVTFNSNGADSGSVDPIDLSADGSAVIPDNSFKKSGYIFSGWNTAADGSGTSYSAGATVEGLISTESEEVTLYAQWTKDTQYTITFNKNGADSGSVASLKAYAHEGFTFPANGFSKAHADFIGWNTKADGSGKVYQPGDKIDSVSANTTYYAQWQMKQSFTVTFEKNGADSGTVSKKTVYADETMTFPANGFTKAHASFIGWNTAADGSGTMYQPGDTMAGLSKNLNFYAQWQMEKTYIVTFDPNGAESGSMNSLTVYESDSVALTKNGFKKAHATFGGWNTASDGSGTSYKDAEEIGTISSDVILYAMWNMDEQYRISFDPNQATGSMNDILVYKGDSFTVPACDFSKEHATFIGWNSKADGSGTSYKVGASVDNVSANMKLYAQWKMDQQFTITFDPNGAESGSINSISVYEGDSFNLPHNGFTKDHGTFAGWNTKADGSGRSCSEDEVYENVTENLTFYAQWTMDRKVTVSFDPNGAESGSIKEKMMYINSVFELPKNVFTKAHAVFEGWNTAPDGSGVSYNVGDEALITDDTMFYAQWRMLNSYSIVFDPNGAEEGTPDSLTVYEDESLTIPENEFVKAHATFTGWNTEPDGTGTSYKAGDTIDQFTQDTTFYAQWKMDRQYTISFDPNGAEEGSMGDMTVYEKTSFVLPENKFSMAHATFTGWNTKADGSGANYTAGSTVESVSKNTVFYAQWVMDRKISVSFDGNGADEGSLVPVTVYINTSFEIPSHSFTKAHAVFTGWNTETDGSGTGYDDCGTFAGATQDTVLYAQWQMLDSHTATFDPNGAESGSVDAIVSYVDEELVLPKNGFSKEHATFLGWNTAADGTGTSYQPGESMGVISEDVNLYAQWQMSESYTVRFDWNSADSGSVGDMTVYADASLVFPENGFTKAHATFKGWSVSLDGSDTVYKPGDSVDGITSDLVFYAQWETDPMYVVNFDWNYANSGSVSDLVVYGGDKFALPKNGFTKEHFTFDGWNTKADGSGTPYGEGGIVDGVNKNTTFYAQWKAVAEYDIRFDWNYANSGSVNNMKAYADSSLVLPENGFTKNHSVFKGWNTSANGFGASYQPGDAVLSVTDDMVFYAQWEELPIYDIRFDWNYANSGSMSNARVYSDETFSTPENGFEKLHATFVCWNTAIDGSGVSYNPGDTIESISEDMTLYAMWQDVATFDVRFDWNYANSGSVGNMTVYADSSFVLPENGFAKDNATFVGWSTVADGTGTVYRPGDSVEPVTEDTVFFAQWKKNPQYTVRFDWNYANSGSVDSITVFEGNAVTVPENGFAKDGFTFSGWNTKADGSGTSFKAGEILESLERDVVLYAQWNELPSVTVTFDWNYADEGEMSSIVVRKGEMVVMPENGFVRNGYYFSGWNTKMDGSGVTIKDAAEIYLFEAVEGKDAVLYAQWESDCTEVTINHPAETKQVCA